MMSTLGVSHFMQSPLVTWCKTFSDEENKPFEYHQLCDGVFLHDIMLQIDPRPPHRGVNKAVEDAFIRIRNLDILVRNVRAFYEEALGHLVLIKLPDIISLTKDPESETSVEDVQGLLLLILGCAVQSDKKEQFIDQIKQLDLNVQHAIVDCIQQVTDNPVAVWTTELCELSLMPEDQQEPMYNLLVQHVRRIIKERDELWHTVNTLVVEKDGGEKCTTPRGSHISILDKHHMGVELAEAKAKLRRARQELEEKNEILLEIREELEQNKVIVNKLRQESLDLLQDARAAKTYRDELDIVKERASKVDKLENEIQRYKDKLNELEFYKSRVEELREDNRILVETKEMLEDQLENSRKRTDQILELENELLKHKARINELTLERDSERDRMQELIEENTQLQVSAKRSMNESANLMVELDRIRSQTNSGLGDSLSDQLNNDAQTKLRKTELENQRLLNLIDNMKESSFHESSDKILELEKENKRLSLKVIQLQDLSSRELQRCLDVEQRNEELTIDANNLQEMIETVKTNSERQQAELQREKEQLLEMVETLRQRNQKSQDARMKDVEAENKKLVENTQVLKSQISRLSFENQQLQKTNARLKENSERLSDIECQKLEVDRENEDLHQAIAAFKSTCDKYEQVEQEHSELQMDYKRLTKLLDNTRITCSKIDRLEQENINLTIENQKLTKILDSLKTSSQKLADMEQEREDLNHLNQALRRNLEALKIDHSRFEQMELDLITQTNENQKLQKTFESYMKKVQETESENQALENENQKLQKTIESLKISNRRLNDLERENTDLEAENHKLDRERKSSEKEVARLKQAIEMKDTTIDEFSSKISTLDRENKRLVKDLEGTTYLSSRVKELEKENREVIQQSTIDKKTLVTLREDLVSEKIKTQQLFNELEKLTSELQKIGLKKEKLMMAEHTQDEDRFKALENMMEEALKKSLNVKDEKIRVLEVKLNESIARNAELKDELSKLRYQHATLQQRQEEELRTTCSSASNVEDSALTSKLTQEVSELKHALSDVEKTNVALTEENRNLRSSVTAAKEQANSMQLQVSSFQHQTTTLTDQNGVLQSLNAKLQVENTTLQSQNASLSTQIATLTAQSASLEADRDQLINRQEELQNIHESLVIDHEALQTLHEQLSTEYESLLNELGSQKTSQKNLKMEFKTLKEKYQTVVTAQEEIDRLQLRLEKERELLKADTKSLNNLRAEHTRLKEDFRLLHTTNEKLKLEYKNLQTEYKGLKTEHNTLKLKNTELQGELADCHDQTNALDVELSKLHSKCEILSHLNNTLEEDRRSLMSQVTTLLAQYHELLTQTLEDKDHFHEEEKSFADKLNNLRRQKEKLEEKIMEQYRRMENYSPKKRGFGANLVRKVRRAGTELMNRVPRSARNKDREKDRSRQTPDSTDVTDTLDNVSLGSGSVSNESPDSGSDATLRKSLKDDAFHHSESVSELINQAGQTGFHRHLAFSTTALNARKSTPPNMFNSLDQDKIMRGSFSSEDIMSLRTESRNSEGRQADVESIASSIASGRINSEDIPLVTGDRISKNRLSLSTPGSRRPVYYADENDTIPTRDVGPNVELPSNKSPESQDISAANNINKETQQPTTPRSGRKNTEAKPVRVSYFTTATPTSSPLMPARSSFRSSMSCFGRTSPIQDVHSPKKQANNSNSDNTTTGVQKDSTSNHSSPSHRSSPGSITLSPVRNRQSWHQPESSQTDEINSMVRNSSSVSPNRRPNLLAVNAKLSNNSQNQPLPEKSNLNNVPPSAVNNGDDESRENNSKPPDNSIWYEYGCV